MNLLTGSDLNNLRVGDYCSWTAGVNEVVVFRVPTSTNIKSGLVAVDQTTGVPYGTNSSWSGMLPSSEEFPARHHPLEWYIDKFHEKYPKIVVVGEQPKPIKRILRVVMV